MLRSSVIVPAGAKVKFEVPEPGGDFTWGKPVASTRRLQYAAHLDRYGEWADSVAVEVPLQVFATGQVTIPGVVVNIDQTPSGGKKQRMRTPGVRLLVLPTVTAADSAQGLKPVRGPLGAPWWERVPWTLVLLVALAVALAVVAWGVEEARARRRRCRRRVRRPRPRATRRPKRSPSWRSCARSACRRPANSMRIRSRSRASCAATSRPRSARRVPATRAPNCCSA
ncbi:MAG: hypothetical protein IPJ04_11310 [Candidatus Eisenbacteria bacterium]|nr:hypothetical protein [Candidatus Eisenbacteria bacterium]